MEENEIMKIALEKYCSPYGKPNPETYAFIEGMKYRNGQSPSTPSEPSFTPSQILKAAEQGEVSITDAKHIVEILEKDRPT